MGSVTLVRAGAPVACIVLPAQPTEIEQQAASDLRNYIKIMSGAELSITAGDVPDSEAVIIGRHPLALSAVGNLLNDDTLGYDGIVISTHANKLVLVGNRGQGTIHAVTRFLETLGCRFYLPHPDGHVVPARDTITVGSLDYVHKPSFANRDFWGDKLNGPELGYADLFREWQRRTYIGGHEMVHGHCYAGFCSPERYFAEHPEYFPLVNVDGKMQRVKIGQLCLSNPEVLKLAANSAIRSLHTPDRAAASLSPNDEYGWCECANCKAMDSPDPKVGVAWRALKFNNQVAEIVRKQCPDQYLAYYAEYINFPGPPVGMKADAMIIPVIVNQYDCIHSVSDRVTSDYAKTGYRCNADYVRVFDEWARIADRFIVYEWYDFPKHPIPSPMLYPAAERVKFYRDRNVVGYCGQIIGRSPVTDLTIYVVSQLLWDSSRSPESLTDEFFKLYFAESGDAMRDYYRMLHEPTTFNTRFRGFFAPAKAWTPELIARLYRTLDRAEAVARQDVVKRRLARERKCLMAIDLITDAYRTESKRSVNPALDTRAAVRAKARRAIRYLESIKGEAAYSDGQAVGTLNELIEEMK